MLSWFGKKRKGRQNPWRPRVGAASDVGRLREHNEDCPGLFPERGLFMVADGMGGHQAGEVASRLAVDFLAAYLDGEKLDTLAREPQTAGPVLSRALERANEAVHRAGREDPDRRGMGTTAVLALAGEGLVHLAHVGDSRAYLQRAGELKQLTRDHSLVAELLANGRMTLEEAAVSPMRGALTQALGGEKPVVPGYSRLAIKRGDRLLLCSDGLWDMLNDRQILEVLQRPGDPSELCDQLVAAANRAGGEDNITVLLLEF